MFITRVCRRYFADNTKRKDEDKNRNAPVLQERVGAREGTRSKENGPWGWRRGGEREGEQDDALERVLFSIYGTFRYREMRLFSRERREDLCSSVLFTIVGGARREANERQYAYVIDTVIVVRSHFMRI